MGKMYFPYVEDTLKVIVDLFSYKHSKDIRLSCMHIAKNLMMSCDKEDYMAKVLGAAMPHFLQELANLCKLNNHEEIVTVLTLLVDCFKLLTSPLIDIKYVIEMINGCTSSLKVCSEQKKEVI